ncbi:hypothetical protein GCM10007939_26130 [Amylibacter marinus]|uniref:Uncharacterized protein n=1 Tax=Amylibacter marinus TaxID=1475483 RepID=A0ABQ5VYR0_9RHOB|nr:hypothetical protein GCM10007939_26130 [Amylibacter marinus]
MVFLEEVFQHAPWGHSIADDYETLFSHGYLHLCLTQLWVLDDKDAASLPRGGRITAL